MARLQAQGQHVLSAHVADPLALEAEKDMPPREVFERDTNWVKDCDAMIAEVSTPSLGVGYEYALAVQLGKPVLCVYRSGVRLSKMITGNPAPNLTVVAYSSEAELDDRVAVFLNNLTRWTWWPGDFARYIHFVTFSLGQLVMRKVLLTFHFSPSAVAAR